MNMLILYRYCYNLLYNTILCVWSWNYKTSAYLCPLISLLPPMSSNEWLLLIVSRDMLCHNFPSTILPPKLGVLKLPTSKVPFSIPWVDSDHHCAPLSGFCGRVDAPRRLLFRPLEWNWSGWQLMDFKGWKQHDPQTHNSFNLDQEMNISKSYSRI